MFSLPIPAQGTELKHRHFVLCVCVCVCIYMHIYILSYYIPGERNNKIQFSFPWRYCCVQKGVSMKHIGGKRFIVCKT